MVSSALLSPCISFIPQPLAISAEWNFSWQGHDDPFVDEINKQSLPYLTFLEHSTLLTSVPFINSLFPGQWDTKLPGFSTTSL